ncbi:MAG: winged helix-turn-helix domain-containing protein [Panacagrimonas sp.]
MEPKVKPETALYRYRFGDAEFDEARLELRLRGLVVELEQKLLQLLADLLRHSGEVVTRAELLERVWPGRVVVEAALTNAIVKLRKGLDDDGDMILTVRRVGYRFTAPESPDDPTRCLRAVGATLGRGEPVHPRRIAQPCVLSA